LHDHLSHTSALLVGGLILLLGCDTSDGPQEARCDPRQADAKGEAALERGDVEAAVEAARGCAEAGLAEYQFTLALLLNDDVEDASKPKRDAEVLEWLRAAASQGHTEAASQLAFFHRWGHVGLPKDEEMALCWDRVAEGQEAASECLGEASAHSARGGCDPKRAELEGERAAERLDFRGVYEAGLPCAEAGRRDFQFGIGYLIASGDAGEVLDLSEAERNLEALRWVRRAAAQFHEEAARMLADAHERGFMGLPPDPVLARCWSEVVEGIENPRECLGTVLAEGLTSREKKALEQTVNALELGAELRVVRSQLPVAFDERAHHTKKLPARFTGTSLRVDVLRNNPDSINEVHDVWVSLRFDPEGKLRSITSRAEGIAPKHEPGGALESYQREWLDPQVAEIRATGCSYVPARVANQYAELTYFESCAWKTDANELVVMRDHLENLSYEGGLAALSAEGQYFYVNEQGESAPVVTYDNGADYFVEGRARTVREGKVGFIDRQLRLVIPPRYDWAFPFEGGRALVCEGCARERSPGEEHSSMVGGTWGYIDTQGKEAVPIRYTCEELPEIGGRSEWCRVRDG
jgi:TPR repeat protein